MNLSQISIGIKTFLRYDLLQDAIMGIKINLPQCPIIIADDGRPDVYIKQAYRNLMLDGPNKVITLPFDSGFGCKNNHIVSVLNTPYLLMASDDFDFSYEAALGINTMFAIMCSLPDIDIVSGRVNNKPYEFKLRDEGNKITEIPVKIDPDKLYNDCDLTVNYSLIRRRVFEKVRWDDDVKIGGGEHGSWFVDVKRAGFKVVYAPGVNINEQLNRNPGPEYIKYRNRARCPERPCFDKRGITDYILGNGQVDYKK